MPAAPKQRKGNRHDPLATSTSTSTASSSTSVNAGPSKIKGPKPLESRDGSGIPGISKLKSQIRQTKRFLAKDNLEPGLRISTQRRLTSLEADLVKAEQRDLAKKNGGRYHMIKFFERQKLTRIIKRCKKKLGDEKEIKVSKKSGYEKDLLHARVMYNYILHYPNEQKYISLFPSETSSTEETKSKLPPHLSSTAEPTEKSDKRRLEILHSIQNKMQRGEISSTPEEEGRGSRIHLDVESTAGVSAKTKKEVTAPKEEDDFFEAE